MIHERFKLFLKKNNVFYNSQFGFRKSHSTQHAIVEIVSEIQVNLDTGLFTCGIFIDLKKAFDTVDHSTLLDKLAYYGVRGIMNDWPVRILSSLRRTKTTQINHFNKSEKEPTLCGVPQGFVLGPL